VAREGLGLDAPALEAFHRAAELEAAEPDPYFRMGVIHARRGAWAEASTAYERALARDPAHLR